MKEYLALKASAGSGKTFALTVRYISLMLLDAKVNEILTLTFTNKAANEMSERIYNTLLTLGDDEIYLQEIIKESGLKKEYILGKKESLLKDFSSNELSIYTIDKFVNKILREFCGYLGITDDFEIKEDDVDELSLKFLNSLDEEKFNILINFLLHENKKYNSIFELFKVLNEKNEILDVPTIDINLISLQKNEILKQAFLIKDGILESSLSSASAKKAVDYMSFEELITKTWITKDTLASHSYFKKPSSSFLEEIFINFKLELEKYFKLRSTYTLSILFEIFEIFKNYKKKFNIDKNTLEFNDISNLVYELLSSKIDKDFLYFRLDSKYNHMLIDEFQDTSLLQFNILKPLIEEVLSGKGNSFKTFFYVGDTKQSIYRFRGGKRELFDYVSKTYSLIEVEQLNTNYRSCENIVNYVNECFLTLKNYDYFAQESLKKEGYVEVINDEALIEDEKFRNIAAKIALLLKEGVDINDVAILTYTNDDVLSLFSYLSKLFPSLKISTEMTSRLTNQENVKALINAVKYLYFKEDIYKENCNALRGKEALTPIDINISLNTNVQKIVKELAFSLKLIDDNVVSFIELCSSYKDIVHFVFDVNKLEASILNKEQIGLQILTIFKSKGLEFDTVILLDRIKKKTANRSSLLFEYDNIFLKNIYYKMKGFESFNENYKNAIEEEKRLSLNDELNILYVAMTRAKHNLFIFKKHEKSVFDIVSIKECRIGKLFTKEIIQKVKEKIKKIEYTIMDLGIQEKQISKTSDSSYTLHSKYFGLGTHYCLEMINDFSLSSLTKSINLTKSRYFNYLSLEDFDSIYKRVEHLIQNDFFIDLVKDATFITEQSVLYNEELKILDLLLYKNETFTICDYKTTKNELNEHIKQVAHYKKAISEIFKTTKVEAFVIYLNSEGTRFKRV